MVSMKWKMISFSLSFFDLNSSSFCLAWFALLQKIRGGSLQFFPSVNVFLIVHKIIATLSESSVVYTGILTSLGWIRKS